LAQRKLSKVIEKFPAGKELILEINPSNPEKTSSIMNKRLRKLKVREMFYLKGQFDRNLMSIFQLKH
jgi:hypothetical protein